MSTFKIQDVQGLLKTEKDIASYYEKMLAKALGIPKEFMSNDKTLDDFKQYFTIAQSPKEQVDKGLPEFVVFQNEGLTPLAGFWNKSKAETYVAKAAEDLLEGWQKDHLFGKAIRASGRDMELVTTADKDTQVNDLLYADTGHMYGVASRAAAKGSPLYFWPCSALQVP